jgi:hypothetical protein
VRRWLVGLTNIVWNSILDSLDSIYYSNMLDYESYMFSIYCILLGIFRVDEIV